MDAESKENNVPPKINTQTKPDQNGHCIPIEPTESENKVRDDLSNISKKVPKESQTRSPSSKPGNAPGPSPAGPEGNAARGIYYGIKSYLHHFYAPPDKEVLQSGEFMQGDDFRFLAEPRRRSGCVRVGLWVGINLVALGGIALLIGYLTPLKQAIIGQFQEFTVLDRWAVNFNYHLIICQLVGLVTFSFGIIVVVCSLLVANCQSPPPPPAYLVMGAYLPAPTPGKQSNTPTWGIHCIPLSGTLKSVQPQFIRAQY